MLLILTLLIGCTKVTGHVEGRRWNYSTHRQEYQEVTRHDWKMDIPGNRDVVWPADGTGEKPGIRYIGHCTRKKHHEECDSDYVCSPGIDFDGNPEMDCGWETDCWPVYKDWCAYATHDWVTVYTQTESGDDLNPSFPEVEFTNSIQRLGYSSRYDVVISYERKEVEQDYLFHPRTMAEYSSWQEDQIVVVQLYPNGSVKQIIRLEE